MDLQTFDVDVANKLGLECAVIFQNVGYWVRHNSSKPDRQRDGKAWMYMSRREWLEEFSYIGEGTLRSTVQKLVTAGLIETGNYSEGMYARTTWYTLTDAGWELWLKQPKGSANSAKGFGENSQTITDTHSTTTNSTIPPTPKGEPDGFEEIWKAKWSRGEYATHIKHRAMKAYATALKRGHKPEDLLDAVRACAGVSKPGTEYAPMLSTWLNEERWKDAVGTAGLSAAEIAVTEERLAASRRQFDEEMRKRVEAKSAEMRGVA